MLKDMSFSQKTLALELVKRNIDLKKLKSTNVYIARMKDHSEFIIGSYTGGIGFNHGLIFSNKNFVRQILVTNRIPVVQGRLFYPEEYKEALIYALKLRFPIFLRQENAQLVEKGGLAKNSVEFKKEFKRLSELGEGILIEKFFKGKTFRIFYTHDGYVNLLKRNKAYDVSYKTSSLTEGKIYEEVTLFNYASVVKLAKKVLLSFPQIKYISFELICKDIKNDLDVGNYIVSEVYPSPGVNIQFVMVRKNQKKAASEAVADLLFPEFVK